MCHSDKLIWANRVNLRVAVCVPECQLLTGPKLLEMQMYACPTSGLDPWSAGLLRSWAALPQGPRDQLALPPFMAFPPAMMGKGEVRDSSLWLWFLRKGDSVATPPQASC